MIEVVAGVLERDGRVLICRRRAGQRHPLKWEFPGGKVEPGEDPVRALARELDEELGIRARIGTELLRYEYTYPGRSPISLIFFHVAEFIGEPRNLIFDSMEWEEPAQLSRYDFVEGDIEFVAGLRGRPPLVAYTGKMSRMVPPGENEFLAQLESKIKGPSHFFRVMAHTPRVLETFVPLYGSVMGPGRVGRRVKELVYLACSYANHCAYCAAAHTASGARAGITAEEMDTLRAGRTEGFSPPERAAIAYALELTGQSRAGASRAALQEHFDDAQRVEITLVAAMASFTNRFNNGLEVPLEPEV